MSACLASRRTFLEAAAVALLGPLGLRRGDRGAVAMPTGLGPRIKVHPGDYVLIRPRLVRKSDGRFWNVAAGTWDRRPQ